MKISLLASTQELLVHSNSTLKAVETRPHPNCGKALQSPKSVGITETTELPRKFNIGIREPLSISLPISYRTQIVWTISSVICKHEQMSTHCLEPTLGHWLAPSLILFSKKFRDIDRKANF